MTPTPDHRLPVESNMGEALRALADDEGRPLPATPQQRLEMFRSMRRRRRVAQTGAAVVAVFALGIGGAALGNTALTDTINVEPADLPAPDASTAPSTTTATPPHAVQTDPLPLPADDPTTSPRRTTREETRSSPGFPRQAGDRTTAPREGVVRRWEGVQFVVPQGWSVTTNNVGQNQPGAEGITVSDGNTNHNRVSQGLTIMRFPSSMPLDPAREAGGRPWYDGPCGLGENYRRITSTPMVVNGTRGVYSEFGCSFPRENLSEQITAVQWIFPSEGLMVLSEDRFSHTEQEILRSIRF